MRERLERAALVAVVLAILGAVGAQVAHRFESGEVFPRASSLSSAPDGTAALAGALARLSGVRVERALEAGADEACAEDCALLVFGLPAGRGADPELLGRLEGRARAGARVVLAFAPIEATASCAVCARPTEAGTRKLRSSDEEALPPAWWRALGFERRPLPATGESAAAQPVDGGPAVPLATALVVTRLPAEARVVARRGEAAVAVEIGLGRGRLLVLADDSPFLNRALGERRATAWLTLVLGAARHVVFEETHLGVERSGGVMVLARRYRLMGVLAALAVLALLHVWRARSPLAPALDEEPSAAEADGRSSFRGLVVLLERGIPRSRLLATCVEAARGAAPGSVDERTWREWSALARAGGDPVAGYERIRAALAREGERRR